MANPPISFSPYLGWVDVTDPNNIPEGTQKIDAANLLRIEKGVRDVAVRSNLHNGFINVVAVPVGSDWTLRTIPVPTTSRPSASILGAGATIFDTTLNKPLWSTGVDWVDAMGADPDAVEPDPLP